MTAKMSNIKAMAIFTAVAMIACGSLWFLQVPYYCFDHNISCVQEKVVVFSAMVQFLIFIGYKVFYTYCQRLHVQLL